MNVRHEVWFCAVAGFSLAALLSACGGQSSQLTSAISSPYAASQSAAEVDPSMKPSETSAATPAPNTTAPQQSGTAQLDWDELCATFPPDSWLDLENYIDVPDLYDQKLADAAMDEYTAWANKFPATPDPNVKPAVAKAVQTMAVVGSPYTQGDYVSVMEAIYVFGEYCL